ncbi:MAG: response regulator [Bacteroidetes bacterium]|nr:response regulator [Bacteroidota bacterium]
MNANKKILIVDDEPDILEFLSYNFRKKEFDVFTANSGLQGVKFAISESPDIIISDLLMPEMNGIEMCREIRKIGNHIPILFLTAVNDEYAFIDAMLSGGDQYVSKPIRFPYLLMMVNQLMESKAENI